MRPSIYKNEKGEEKPWNNNATVCKEWNATVEADGREPIKCEDMAELKLADDALSRDDTIRSMLQSSDKQVHVAGDWEDEATGLVIPCQSLIDLVPRKNFMASLGDLKTTRSALPSAWRRWSSQRGYHIQGAMYLDMFNAAENDERDTFCFIVVENFSPYTTAKRMLSLDKVNIGRILYQSILKRYCQCLKTGVWPDYDQLAAEAAGIDEFAPKVIEGWTLDEPDKYDRHAAELALVGGINASATPESEEEPEITTLN